MTDLIGNAVNGVVNLVDVDGVVRKVDVDDAVQRIDMNELLDKVDMNRLIDRVDLNRQLDRIDMDRLLRRVDVNAVVLRSNVGSIVAHSTTGIFTEILDTVRASVVHGDIWVYNIVGYLLRRDVSLLPPVPGGATSSSSSSSPSSSTSSSSSQRRRSKPDVSDIKLSTSVQGCFNGVVTKGLAFFIDSFVVTFSFAVWLVIVEMGIKTLTQADSRPEFNRDSRYALVVYAAYWFIYFWFWTVAAHRTLGMALVGLKVVDATTGRNCTVTQGFLRTALLPLSGMVAPFLVVVGLLRTDGRMLHDIVAGTGMIYKWNTAMMKFRALQHQQSQEEQQQQQQQPSQGQSRDSPLLHAQQPDVSSYASLEDRGQWT